MIIWKVSGEVNHIIMILPNRKKAVLNATVVCIIISTLSILNILNQFMYFPPTQNCFLLSVSQSSRVCFQITAELHNRYRILSNHHHLVDL